MNHARATPEFTAPACMVSAVVFAHSPAEMHTVLEPNRVSFTMCGCVGCDHDPSACRPGGDKPESGECTAVCEEVASRSQNQRVDHKHVLVNEIVLHQRPDQLSAAEYHKVLARRLFEPGHGLRSVALEE